MSARPISRKKIVVQKGRALSSYSYGWKEYTASYDGSFVASGDTAAEAREEAVRELVLTGRYYDPRPVSKGGAR